MPLGRVTVVLMWYLIALSSARRTGAEDGEVLEKINSARCTSRCFSLHMTQLTASFKHLQVNPLHLIKTVNVDEFYTNTLMFESMNLHSRCAYLVLFMVFRFIQCVRLC